MHQVKVPDKAQALFDRVSKLRCDGPTSV